MSHRERFWEIGFPTKEKSNAAVESRSDHDAGQPKFGPLYKSVAPNKERELETGGTPEPPITWTDKNTTSVDARFNDERSTNDNAESLGSQNQQSEVGHTGASSSPRDEPADDIIPSNNAEADTKHKTNENKNTTGENKTATGESKTTTEEIKNKANKQEHNSSKNDKIYDRWLKYRSHQSNTEDIDISDIKVSGDFAAFGSTINKTYYNNPEAAKFDAANFSQQDVEFAAKIYSAEIAAIRHELEHNHWVYVDMGDHSACFALMGAAQICDSLYQADVYRGESIKGPMGMLHQTIRSAGLFVKAGSDVFNIPDDEAAKSALKTKLQDIGCWMFISTQDDRLHRNRMGPRDAANFYIIKRYCDQNGIEETVLEWRRTVTNPAIFRDLPTIESGLAACANFSLFSQWLREQNSPPGSTQPPEAASNPAASDPTPLATTAENNAATTAQAGLLSAEMECRASIVEILGFLAYHFPGLDLTQFNNLLDSLVARMDKLQPIHGKWFDEQGQKTRAEILRSELLNHERDTLFGKARLVAKIDSAVGGAVVYFERDAHEAAFAARMAANPNFRMLMLEQTLQELLPADREKQPINLTFGDHLEGLTAALLVTAYRLHPALAEPYAHRFIVSNPTSEICMLRYQRFEQLLRGEPRGEKLLAAIDKQLQTNPFGSLMALWLAAMRQSPDVDWLEAALRNSWNSFDDTLFGKLQRGFRNLYTKRPDRWLFALEALLRVLERGKSPPAMTMAGVLLNELFVWADQKLDENLPDYVHPLRFVLAQSINTPDTRLAARLTHHWLSLSPVYGISEREWNEGRIGEALFDIVYLLQPQMQSAPVDKVFDAIPMARTVVRFGRLLAWTTLQDTKHRPHRALDLAGMISKTIKDLYPGMSSEALRCRHEMRAQIMIVVRTMLADARKEGKFSAHVDQVCAKLLR